MPPRMATPSSYYGANAGGAAAAGASSYRHEGVGEEEGDDVDPAATVHVLEHAVTTQPPPSLPPSLPTEDGESRRHRRGRRGMGMWWPWGASGGKEEEAAAAGAQGTTGASPRYGALALALACALLAIEAGLLLRGARVSPPPSTPAAASHTPQCASDTPAPSSPSWLPWRRRQQQQQQQSTAVAPSSDSDSNPFAGLGRWVGAQQEAGAIRTRYQEVRREFEGYLKEIEEAAGTVAGGGGGSRWWRRLLPGAKAGDGGGASGGERKRKDKGKKKRGMAEGWEVLTSSKDGRLRVSLRWPDAAAPGRGVPMLIAEGIYYNATAADLFEAMRVGSTLATMPYLDPFFEGYKTIKTYDTQTELGHRTTKRLLIYGKRDFLQMAVEEKLKTRGGGGGGGRGSSGEEAYYISASLSIPEGAQQDPSGPWHALARPRDGYTRGYQDLVGFYSSYTPPPPPPASAASASASAAASTVPAARATLIMRTDLRGHIPHWAFSKSAGMTGMHLLHALQTVTGALDHVPRA